MRTSLLQMGKFIRHGKHVAALVPSSPWLARALAAHVDPDTPQTILELGAGTGNVTEVIARKMHPDSRLISIEIDPQFHAIAAKRCPQATILNCDALELPERLDSLGVVRIDQFVSCLPTPSLPAAVVAAVLACWRDLAGAGAYFTQLTQIPWLYQSMYERWFDDVRFQLVGMNLPPGGVYHCRGLREGVVSSLGAREER